MTMRLILNLLVAPLLLFSTAACAQDSEEEFRNGMLPRLAKSLPGATLSPKADDPLAIIVKGGHLDGAQINLNRIYGYCQQASAADCESEKQGLIGAVTVKPEPATPATLRLIVRDQQYVDWVRQANAGQSIATDLILEPLGGGLYAILAYESSNAVGSVNANTLKELGLTREQAWALARSQTEAILPQLPDADQVKASAVLFQDHKLGSSLLIDLPAWTKLAASVGPNLFMTVVSDELVFVGVMSDGPDFEAFRKTVAEDCANQQRCISPNVFRFRNGRWVVAQ